jgi:hypothetical protein
MEVRNNEQEDTMGTYLALIGLFVGGFVIWLRFRVKWQQIQFRLKRADELAAEVERLKEENSRLKAAA